MATNNLGTSLINKYVWLIETIDREGPVTFNELNRKWIDKGICRTGQLHTWSQDARIAARGRTQ